MQGNLGFGMMRLPIIDRNTKQNLPLHYNVVFDPNGNYDVDHEQVCRMVDKFLDAGFTYFDTSYVYLNSKSEPATREALVKRHPRDSFTLATKLPTFLIKSKDDAPNIFEQQLANCGVEFFDYYLLHTLRGPLYDPVVVKFGLFEFVAEQKKRGRIRNLGFSFHDSPELLDRILTEHPETDFVQIPVSYYDWDSYFVRARRCYEVIRKHGKRVVIMQPVKGGTLAKVPDEAERLMRELEPEMSTASWALRFAAELDGVIAVLSGMSTLAQVEDNISFMKNFKPLTSEQKALLPKVVELCKLSGPLHRADYSMYEGIASNGMPVAGVLDTYNSCMIQPDPTFATENNYYATERYAAGRHGSWIDGAIIDREGNDITQTVRDAEAWLMEHDFVGNF